MRIYNLEGWNNKVYLRKHFQTVYNYSIQAQIRELAVMKRTQLENRLFRTGTGQHLKMLNGKRKCSFGVNKGCIYNLFACVVNLV